MRRTPSQSLLGSALLLYLVADAAAAQTELDLAGALIAALAGALSLAPLLASRTDMAGRKRVGWLGLALGCALVRLAAPRGLSAVVEVTHVLGVSACAALIFDLSLVAPDRAGNVRRLRLMQRASYTLCLLCAMAGVWAEAPAIHVLGTTWLAPAAFARAPYVALLLALCGALGWRSVRRRFGSTPEAMASNTWAMLGLIPATALGVLLATSLLWADTQPLAPVTRAAIALAACGVLFGHLRMLDRAQRLSAGRATRESVAAALTIVLVTASSMALRAYYPTAPLSAGATVGAVLIATGLLWQALRELSRVALSPVAGRLLQAVAHAHEALTQASTLDDVAGVVLRAARAASGEAQSQPLLQLFYPALQFSIDAAGQAHQTTHRLHPEIERALRQQPGEIIMRAPLEAQIVRAPALRPLVDALCSLDALCVLPLLQQSDLEGALLFPRAARRTHLTLEELDALRRLARHIAGFLSVLASDARAQQRATEAFAAAERADLARVSAEQALRLTSAELRALRAGGSEAHLTAALVSYGSAMRALLARLSAVACSDVPVLLVAERGVPLEPLARLLHEAGGRKQEALIVGESAALRPETCAAALLGSREQASPGWLELAARGTLLLCDLPALSLEAQRALADALLQRHARPIDAEQPYACDVRLVASCRLDPDMLVAEGALSPALRERLPLVLRVPPLRERPEDLPSLLLDALDHSSRVLGRAPVGLDPAAQARLLAYRWPGNIDELQAVIEHAVAHCRGSRVLLSDLPPLGPTAKSIDAALDGTLEEIERRVLQRALDRAAGNKSEAARLLGLKRPTFFDKLRRHNLDDDDKDSSVPN